MEEFSSPRVMVSQIGLDLQKMSGKIGAAVQKDIADFINKIEPKLRAGISVRAEPSYAGGFNLSFNIEKWVDNNDRKVLEDKVKSYLDMIGARHGACSGPAPEVLGTIISR